MGLKRELLIDHYRNPRNYGSLADPDFSSGLVSPSCGDQVSFEGNIENGIITTLMFQGEGSLLSQGIASLLTEVLVGKSIETVLALDEEAIVDLIGERFGPTRMRTALLPLQALQKGLRSYGSS